MRDLKDDDLQRILENDTAGVLALLPDLTPAAVVRLQEIEIEGANRTELVDAINAYIEQRQGDVPPEDTAPAMAAKTKSKPSKESAKAQRGEEIPDELKTNYNGPLTIDLMERRRAFFEGRGK